MALKVIELEVDESLSGDTRVEEIALVLQPAIETEFVYFKQQGLAEIGQRGGIKESKKAPKSDTPNPNPKGEGSAKGDASSTRGAEVTQRVEDILKGKSDDFNERYKDKLGYGVNVGMLKSVYQRGVGAYNVSHSPAVKSAEQWALARVNAFLYLVKNGRPENSKYKGDNDLLPTEHPKKEKMSTYEFQESYSDYPKSVREAADSVLKYTERYGWGSCGTPVGKQRANQLAKGEPISLDTIKRMYSYLSRHKKDLESSKTYDDGCGKLMYDSWGGETALGWAERKIRQVEEEMGYDIGSLSPWSQTTGTTEMCGCGGDYVEEQFVKPMPGEDKEKYISRCISYVIKEGATQEQAAGKCYGMWENFYVDDTNCGCGCWNDGTVVDPESNLYFENILINGVPVFESEDDAATYAQTMGCNGAHEHIIDGKVYYMPCEVHPPDINDVDDYSEEEYEAAKLLKFLAETNYEEFEAVVGSLRGATEAEVKRRNHKNPTTYFKYDRVLDGFPDRDFCVSIEGRYFRRLEIDLLRDFNTEFGHNRNPYSKWLYKGGPECVHAWRRYLVQGKDIEDLGLVEGTPGTPPKSLPNNGYYSAETKRRSQQAYIISQKQGMSKQIKPTQFKYDGEKRMIYSPAMKPGILIPRIDEVSREKYFVTFKPETIERMAQRYMIDKRTGAGHTNYEHTDKKLEEVYLVESWIVDGEMDKAYSLGYSKDQVPKGTWMVGFRVDSPEVWEMVKNGEIKGISIEGNFEYKFSSHREDEYLLNEIINIINQIK